MAILTQGDWSFFVQKDLTEHFYDRLGTAGAELHNLYGPTEAAVDVTWWRCERFDVCQPNAQHHATNGGQHQQRPEREL